jgi:chemotaxis protein methyltransferase CheR
MFNRSSTPMMTSDPLIGDLLEKINTTYGIDFSQYSYSSLIRRISTFLTIKRIQTKEELINRIQHEKPLFESFLEHIAVPVTQMFRDPSYYKSLRELVTPQLATYAFTRVWSAGCSTGEEAYSLAILLDEEGVKKYRIYATDINHKVLIRAKEGIYDSSTLAEYHKNYTDSGGSRNFSDYYVTNYNRVIFDNVLKKNITFALHNLATDKSFNEFNLIVCRNVLIYFNKDLQNKVIELFIDSLCMFGYLALGKNESLFLTKFNDCFELVDKAEKIYKRIK